MRRGSSFGGPIQRSLGMGGGGPGGKGRISSGGHI